MPRPGLPGRPGPGASGAKWCGSRRPSARDGDENAVEREGRGSVLLEVASGLGDAIEHGECALRTPGLREPAQLGLELDVDEVRVAAELQHDDVAEHRLQV